jgi:hypothetical protein
MDLEFIRPSEETYRANLFWQINDPKLSDDTSTQELERILDEIFLESVPEHTSVDEDFYGDF